MTTLIQRIDGTRSHLTRESLALASRTRRAAALEATQWRVYFVSQRDLVRTEVRKLASPRAFERAVLKFADDALSHAHETVHARLTRIERELSRATKASHKPKKARPAAKRPRSRRLVTEPTVN
jgi:hypothetical protein